MSNDAGIYLSLDDLLVLLPLLKKHEDSLRARERKILVQIEKKLYEHLSIADIERRLGGSVEYA